MDFNPQLPPLPTLTLTSTQLNDPPDKPADPHILVLFPENTPYRVPNNPFRGAVTQNLEKEHKQALQEALNSIKAPFIFELEEPIRFEGTNVDTDTSTENFNAAVTTVIAAIEWGYCSTRDPTPLGPAEWARLSSVGRGYHRQYNKEQESHLDKVRAEVIDPNPLTKKNPTLFHRLAAIAGDINQHVGTDQEGYQDWYLTLKDVFTRKVAKAAAADVNEKWLRWKANEIDRLATDHKRNIAGRARNEVSKPTPTTSMGRKRTVSGSPTHSGSVTPVLTSMVPRSDLMVTESPDEGCNGPIYGQVRRIGESSDATTNNPPNPPSQPHNPLPSTTSSTTRQEWQGNQKKTAALPPTPPTRTVHADSGFILIDRQSKKWKGKGKTSANGQVTTQSAQTNIPPASYASVATSAANTQQPQPPRRQSNPLPSITEITVLRTGGHPDLQTEGHIQGRAADAIVRQVRTEMANKGNFVYSFDGCIPFDVIQSYEWLLLAPFFGTGQLCPSMGWTCFVVHGVPVWSDEYTAFDSHAILQETRALPGLKKATFAMQPRWLRPVANLEAHYSSITFAISDPDGVITNTLLNGRAALFGKEVTVQKWIDKPALIQCSRCHALGHNKASKVCSLGNDSVKCYICGGTHKSEKYDQNCNRNHAVAGICDCTHFKCLNCHKPGHNCKNTRCPARDLFRPRGSQKAGKENGKGKERAVATAAPTPDSDGDLYGPPSSAAELPLPQPPLPTAGPSRPRHTSPTLTATDFNRIEEFERMELDRQETELALSLTYTDTPSYTDPLAEWNAVKITPQYPM
ncbi:hypothetical protein BGY98DRAFT_940108 [Russula aff. rugulosa BPL654]|nr:hypothetical protein BGY98DRAFT_940108 [Russula aff. rugulosa BPL654]